MNRQNPVLISLAVALASMACSCNDDCDDLPVYGTDANITSLTVTTPEFNQAALIQGDEIMLVTDCFIDLTDATATVTLSEGASIQPLPETITDWSVPHRFTVTSANGKETRTYNYVVLQDAVELSTQAEVDAYGASKPVWAGNIVITDTEESPITDLSALSTLKHIEYGLTITSCHATEVSLPELESVKSIAIDGETIESVIVPRIMQLSSLRLGYNSALPALKTLDFRALKRIYGDFLVNGALNGGPDFAIRGFEALETLDGEAVMRFSSADLRGFSSLKSVNHLSLSGSISSFAGFENLKEINGVLTFNMLLSPATIEEFRPDKVWAINLKSLQTLENLSFLENVTSMYALVIQGGFCLKSLEGLEKLRILEDELYLTMVGISDLDPLSNLEHIGRAITFRGNSRLTDFSGLKRCLGDYKGTWTVQSNGANPTIEEILNQ